MNLKRNITLLALGLSALACNRELPNHVNITRYEGQVRGYNVNIVKMMDYSRNISNHRAGMRVFMKAVDQTAKPYAVSGFDLDLDSILDEMDVSNTYSEFNSDSMRRPYRMTREGKIRLSHFWEGYPTLTDLQKGQLLLDEAVIKVMTKEHEVQK